MLYANQPEESIDGYTDANLLRLAGKVEGLRGPEFDAAVRSMKYRGFVTASQNAYEKAGGAKEPEGPGTPTAEINGKRIPLQYNALLLESDTFAELLQKIDDQPGEWEDTTL
ncbi:DsbA family protein (plasmid) [Streptomyces sp. DSM 116494]|uniref:DsbA family protein n=1 Tax=Streptomyces okerensis TaxID=3344655 RepID=UPI00388E6E59